MSPELHQLVRKLFDEALEHPSAERLTFLQSACTGQPEAFEQVSRLLAAHVESESFLESTPPKPKFPTHIGRYVVNGELGHGAMGIVYEATDPLIGRSVAVKIIYLQSDTSGNAEFLNDRLFREARSAGRLSHPGIVTVFDVGREGDTAFIAMERVEGKSLQELLVSGRKLRIPVALDILRQAAAALDYAHSCGVVHRDIKPANIMLHKTVIVKIADFGIAKIDSTQNQTATGMVMGTPRYMSPEQIEQKPLDGRSDQFALAVVAYELLTGACPFQADSIGSLVHMIVFGERPSAHLANPALPAAVDGVLLRGLSKLPGERFASCLEFVAALESAFPSAPRMETAGGEAGPSSSRASAGAGAGAAASRPTPVDKPSSLSVGHCGRVVRSHGHSDLQIRYSKARKDTQSSYGDAGGDAELCATGGAIQGRPRID